MSVHSPMQESETNAHRDTHDVKTIRLSADVGCGVCVRQIMDFRECS